MTLDLDAIREQAATNLRVGPVGLAPSERRVLQLVAEVERLRASVRDAVQQLDAEHYPDPALKGRGGCVICWPKDGSWPCVSRMVADELRALAEEA